MGGPSTAPSSSSSLAPFHVGSFYEIDHASLPPGAPAQLKGIRVLMVTDKTDLGITTNYPSVLSLREYFHTIDTDCYGSPASGVSTSPRLGGRGKQKLRHILTGPRPELDEQFDVDATQARRMLRREVPLRELHDSQHLPAFWMIGSSVSSARTVKEEACQEEETTEQEEACQEEETTEQQEEEGPEEDERQMVVSTAAPFQLVDELRRAEGVQRWGSRKKIRHIHDIPLPTQPQPQPQPPTVKSTRVIKVVKRELVEEEPIVAAKAASRKKRKVVASRRGYKKQQTVEKPLLAGGAPNNGRWSAERYSAAEQKLFELLRQSGAVRGRPIPRCRLRDEARKHIGDTGLLDHLLKHLTGKVVPGGRERFRRRHDPDGGGMEYWLEDAQLLAEDDDSRKRTGAIERCYWEDICNIREDISILKKDVKQLSQKQQLEEEEQVRSETAVEDLEEGKVAEAHALRDDLLAAAIDTAAATTARLLQQQQRQLMEWKGGVEGRLNAMSKCLTQTKDEMRQMRDDMQLLKEQNQQLMMMIMQQFDGTNQQLPSPENNAGNLQAAAATATASSTGGGWVANGSTAQTPHSQDEDFMNAREDFSMNTNMVGTDDDCKPLPGSSYIRTTTTVKGWSDGLGLHTTEVERFMQDTLLCYGGGGGGPGSCRAFDPCGGGTQLRPCPSQVSGSGWPLGPQQVNLHPALMGMQFPLPPQVPPPAVEPR